MTYHNHHKSSQHIKSSICMIIRTITLSRDIQVVGSHLVMPSCMALSSDDEQVTGTLITAGRSMRTGTRPSCPRLGRLTSQRVSDTVQAKFSKKILTKSSEVTEICSQNLSCHQIVSGYRCRFGFSGLSC